MSVATVAGYLYKRLREAGATPEATAAMLAQVQKESLFIANNVENGKGWTDEGYTIAVDSGSYSDFVTDGIGYGLFQLTYHTRKKAFLEFVRNRGCSIGDLEAQVDYMLYELRQMFPSLWHMMTTSHDLFYCTKELLYKWENPQEKAENLKERYTYAQKWLDMAKALESSTQEETINTPKETVSANPLSYAIQKVLSLARSEINYHEKATNAMLDEPNANIGSGNFTKYGRDLDAVPSFYNGKKNGYAWCDQFVDWLFFKCFGADVAMQMLCQPKNSAGAGCEYSKNYYQAQGRFDRNPHPGDQIFFYDSSGHVNHTGIVDSVDDYTVNTIEGNSSDRVQRQSYDIDSGYIAGYGHPKWELGLNTSSGDADITITTTTKIYLREGMKGAKIKQLQNLLIALHYDVGPDGADGDFGRNTKTAVMKFQNDNGLVANGIVDEKTTELLNSVTSKSLSSVNKLQYAKGETVKFIGNKHYVSATSMNGKGAKPGLAKITRIAPGTDHPYHLVKLHNGGSTVFGWVNENDIQPKLVEG